MTTLDNATTRDIHIMSKTLQDMLLDVVNMYKNSEEMYIKFIEMSLRKSKRSVIEQVHKKTLLEFDYLVTIDTFRWWHLTCNTSKHFLRN